VRSQPGHRTRRKPDEPPRTVTETTRVTRYPAPGRQGCAVWPLTPPRGALRAAVPWQRSKRGRERAHGEHQHRPAGPAPGKPSCLPRLAPLHSGMPPLKNRGAGRGRRAGDRDDGQERTLGDGAEDLVRDTEHDPQCHTRPATTADSPSSAARLNTFDPSTTPARRWAGCGQRSHRGGDGFGISATVRYVGNVPMPRPGLPVRWARLCGKCPSNAVVSFPRRPGPARTRTSSPGRSCMSSVMGGELAVSDDEADPCVAGEAGYLADRTAVGGRACLDGEVVDAAGLSGPGGETPVRSD
jgi:hypothetical protein